MDLNTWALEAKMKCDFLKKRIREPQGEIDDYTWHMMHVLLRSYQKDYSVLKHMADDED